MCGKSSGYLITFLNVVTLVTVVNLIECQRSISGESAGVAALCLQFLTCYVI
jgi:hypothetical protein